MFKLLKTKRRNRAFTNNYSHIVVKYLPKFGELKSLGNFKVQNCIS